MKHKSDFEGISIERLQELCASYENKLDIYYNEIRNLTDQIKEAELLLSKCGYIMSEEVGGETYYGYIKI